MRTPIDVCQVAMEQFWVLTGYGGIVAGFGVLLAGWGLLILCAGAADKRGQP